MSDIFDDFDFRTIKKLSPCNIPKVLPTAYSDTLSYYETLNKLIDKVTELQKAIEDGGFEDSILARANQYTDAMIHNLSQNINDQISDLSTEITSFENRTNSTIEELRASTADALVRLNLSITELYQVIMNYNEYLDNRFEMMYNDLIRYIDEEIDARDTVYVYSPVTNRRVPIQTALWDMYNSYMREFAVTAGEYDNLRLTAEVYDSKRLTAYDYDNNFKQLMKDFFNLVMNPFTGLKSTLTDVVMTLVNFHRDSIDCGEYDSMSVSAGDYDALDITAYAFDFDSRNALVPII